MPPLDDGRAVARADRERSATSKQSLADNRPRSLIQMATGSGKTFTAVNFCYRLIKFAKAKRILFLVDRNNLGRQTLNEFQQFVSPYNGYKFTEEYTVQHLKQNTHRPGRARSCITTIQRLYSMLKGEEEFAGGERGGLAVRGRSAARQGAAAGRLQPEAFPIETFDFIVVDECHRIIYNLWRQVLEYFDAFLIGLTATPTAQTIGFFNGNLVQDYTHEQAVADGVNVGYDVYRIETRSPRTGAKLVKRAGRLRPAPRPPHARRRSTQELDDDLTYTANQLDRDVVGRGPDPAGRPHVPRPAAGNLPRPHRGAQDADLRQDRPARRGHRRGSSARSSARATTSARRSPSKTTGKKPEDAAQRVPQQLHPADRRHRGHDRHRHRREAAGMPALHAEHQVARRTSSR